MGRGGKATRETPGESEGGGRQHDPDHQLKVVTKKKSIWKYFISFLCFSSSNFALFNNKDFIPGQLRTLGGDCQ